jgi:hypothetical protein
MDENSSRLQVPDVRKGREFSASPYGVKDQANPLPKVRQVEAIIGKIMLQIRRKNVALLFGRMSPFESRISRSFFLSVQRRYGTSKAAIR